jgi:hypothetical protein
MTLVSQCLRHILRISWPGIIPHNDLRKATDQDVTLEQKKKEKIWLDWSHTEKR